MKKIYLTLIIVFNVLNFINAQPYFVKHYGTTNYDRCFSITANGNHIVQVGTSYGFSSTQGDVYWMMTNRKGVLTSSYYVDLKGDDVALSVKHNQTYDHYITTGYTNQADSDSICGRDVFLLESDTNGVPLWTMRYGAVGVEDVGQSVIVTSDNHYLVAGYTAFTCDSDSMVCTKYNVLLIKTDFAGNIVWSKSIDIADRNDYGMKVIEAGNGDYYIAGYSESGGLSEPFLMNVTSSNGTVNWVGFYGDDHADDKAFSLVEHKDGITVVGHTYGFNSGGRPDILVFSTDYSGTEIWKAEYNTMNNSQASFGRDIVRDEDFYYITGYADDISNAGNYDVDYLVIDKNGIKQVETNIGGINDERGYSIVATPNGNKITGYSYTWTNGWDDAIQLNLPFNGQVGNCYLIDTIRERYISGYIFPYFSSCDYMYSDTDSVIYQDAFYQRLICGSDSDTLVPRLGKFEYESLFSLRSNIIGSNDPLNVLISCDLSDEVTFTIWSSEGRLINSYKRSIRKGYNEIPIPTDDLKSGSYLIRASGRNISKTLRFIRMR